MTYSQAGQDTFVVETLEGMRDGFFLDIGCAMPMENNNTFLLESRYNWSGLLFEIDTVYVGGISLQRTSPLILGDATVIDFRALFREYNVPKVIDYISLDLDPPDSTFKVLEALPLDTYSFKCMTFEHDRYWYGSRVAEKSRTLLERYGYEMAVKDVKCSKGPFEDWWVKK